MAILVKRGRAAIAEAIKNSPIHMAWGTGDGAWTDKNVPPEDSDATALINEVGRRLVSPSRVEFCDVSAAGEIIVDGGRFTSVNYKTNYLHITVNFEYEDASASTIREVALYLNTKTDPALPPGQFYFTPDQIADPGTILNLEHLDVPLVRSSAVRAAFDFVVAI